MFLGVVVNVGAKVKVYQVTSLEDIYNKNIKIMFQTNGGIHKSLRNSNPGSTFRKLWETNILPYGEEKLGVPSADEGFQFVAANPGYAFLHYSGLARRHPLYPCEVTGVPGLSLQTSYSAFALQKNSPLREIFNFHLLGQVASGVVKKAKENYWIMAPVDCPVVPEEGLAIQTVIGIFVILMLGTILALATTLMEKYLATCVIFKSKDAFCIVQPNVKVLAPSEYPGLHSFELQAYPYK